MLAIAHRLGFDVVQISLASCVGDNGDQQKGTAHDHKGNDIGAHALTEVRTYRDGAGMPPCLESGHTERNRGLTALVFQFSVE